MKTKLLFLLIFCFSISSFGQKLENKKNLTPIKVYASGKVENVFIKPRKMNFKSEPTASFDIEYIDFTEEAKAAFNYAADLWTYMVSSPVPITIQAKWEQMDQYVLGSSGPPDVYQNFPNATFKDTWYQGAVANRLAGYDVDPTLPDMIITFNSDYEWYFGTDGQCPNDLTDFVTIVLHEIAHGLGFSSNGYVNGDDGGIGYWTNDGGTPAPWDHFMYNGDNELLIDRTLFDNPSTELAAELTSNNVFFDSPLSNKANNNDPAKLYAPSPWNGGSSLSHLDEIFNDTEHALMTYSAGTGEVLHDPGDITMGILAEVGWVNVRFDHKNLKDIEEFTSPVTVDVNIYSDSLLYNDSVYLFYSDDNFETEYKVQMTTSDGVAFSADIPVLSTDKVNYYMKAKTHLDRTYYYPSQGVLNPESIDTSLFFTVATDNTMPQLLYTKDREFIYSYEESLDFVVEADDNLGIDSVFIEYKVNDNEYKNQKLEFFDENLIGLPKYKATISFTDESLQNNDTIYYRIVAVDLSTSANQVYIPENGYYKLPVQSLLDVESDMIISFDDEDDDKLFFLDGFTISKPSGFNSNGLHSPHPYVEGEDYPGKQFEYVATLKVPFVIKKDSSFITYDEIVLVEPGEDGSEYGDNYFYDYVIVEGSKDSGQTWYEFEDGYDSNRLRSFYNYYNAGSDGDPGMYKSNNINLLENDMFQLNDTVLIRFRLWSDEWTVGWGWAIDNICVQTVNETTSIDHIANNDNLIVYPNPSKEYINILFSNNQLINDVSVSIYSVDGKLMLNRKYYNATNDFNERLNLDSIESGYYIIKIETNNNVITKSFIKR